MKTKLTPQEYETFKRKPRNYDEEKEFNYPGKKQLLKFESLGELHRRKDLIIDKIIEQILHDVVCHKKGITSNVLQFVDEEEEQRKRKYSTRAKNPNNSVTCAYCKEKFKNENSLKSHVSKAKGTKCSKIHEHETLPANLEKRQKILAKDFNCKYCGKKYSSHDSMDMHVRGVHKKLKQ